MRGGINPNFSLLPHFFPTPGKEPTINLKMFGNYLGVRKKKKMEEENHLPGEEEVLGRLGKLFTY